MLLPAQFELRIEHLPGAKSPEENLPKWLELDRWQILFLNNDVI
jgi:hypothetical protein